MKLSEKYNRLNVAATISIFIIGSCFFYFLLNYILIRELDEGLKSEKQEIESYVVLHGALPEVVHTKNQYTFFKAAHAPLETVYLTGKHNYDGEEEDFREIHFTVAVQDRTYLVNVATPLEGTESMLQAIIAITVAMIAMILLAGYIINRVVIRKLWLPFYETIEKVKGYKIADIYVPVTEGGQIDEFSLLNQSINEMIAKVQQEYNALKGFTGQAAHEMQTPLAVIRSKLDMLVQDEDVARKNGQTITDIERSVQRLSRLHQSLLLLTKVENKQFSLNERVYIDQVVAGKCSEYDEMTEDRNITVSQQLSPTEIIFHHHLADILINNLVNNAIKYNRAGGTIDIVLIGKILTITNTSRSGQLDPFKIFKPFYRSETDGEGSGLGLSIVRQVCDTAGYFVGYDYVDGKHIFSVKFF